MARHCNLTVAPTIVFTFCTPIGTVISVALDVESKGERSFATDCIVGSNPKSWVQRKLFFFAKHSVSLFFQRQSHPKVFCEKGVLKHLTKFTRKHLYQRLFFNKVAGLGLPQLFSCEFWEIFKNTFFHRTSSVAVSVFFVCLHNFFCKKLNVFWSSLWLLKRENYLRFQVV